MRKYIAIAIIVFGEIIVFILNVIFGGHLPMPIFVLNAAITMIVFGLCFGRMLFTAPDQSGNKEGRWVATLGNNIVGISSYTLLSVAAILLMNSQWMHQSFGIEVPVAFKYQILAHGILFVLLLAFVFISVTAGEQVSSIYAHEESLKGGVQAMRKAAEQLQDRAALTADIDPSVLEQINSLQDDLRYISPSVLDEATELEQRFVDASIGLLASMTNYKMNRETVAQQLQNLKILVTKRKNVRS